MPSQNHPITCPSPAPKRLLTSANWVCRNDSSNVKAILHPDNYLLSPRLKYGEKTRGDVIEKHVLSHNNCYCRCKNGKLPKPTIFKRPSTCVSYGVSGKSTKDDLKRSSLIRCICNEERNDLCWEKGNQTVELEGLKYTEQREKYEKYRDMQEEEYQRNVQQFKEISETADERGGGDSEFQDVNTILGTQQYDTVTSLSNYNQKYDSRTNITSEYNSGGDFPQYSVPEFRKEHYYETHNIGKLGENKGYVPQNHKCVHQFKLDDRWLPEAVNRDPFGRSKCKLCDKPMEGSDVNFSFGSGYLFSEKDHQPIKSKLQNYAEAYKSGLMPSTVNLGRGKSTVEVLLKESDVAKLRNYVNKVHTPVYCNSLALRQQRMRLI